MQRYRLTMIVDIDEEELIEHVTSGKAETSAPYTTLVSEWDAADYFHAYDEGILDEHEAVLVSVEAVKENEGEDEDG
jgi:hypothetical protein